MTVVEVHAGTRRPHSACEWSIGHVTEVHFAPSGASPRSLPTSASRPTTSLAAFRAERLGQPSRHRWRCRMVATTRTSARTSSNAQFAADVSSASAKLMAATQRPVTDAALSERSGEPAWKTVRSWFIYGDRDLNIPPAAQSFMAKRAGSKETVVVKGASHVVMVSQPHAVTGLIERAAAVAAAEVAAQR